MSKKLKILLLILLASINLIKAQNFTDKEKMLQRVFDNIVNAYGNAKAPPELILLSSTQKESVLARYFPNPRPIIKIDEKIVDICRELGKDSLNALAFLLGHELAHYYAEHPWCSDYAFALRNSPLGKALKQVSINEKIEKESFADSKGLFYASVAGYQPFSVFNLLIDKIYLAYKLQSNLVGYPSKEDRKNICARELRRVKEIYPLFIDGLAALNRHQYDNAINNFNRLIQEFPSREMYNNAGAAALLYALELKPLPAKEFIYPVEADTITRLYKGGARSYDAGIDKKLSELLATAKKNFEKAIFLDPEYSISKINLASVYDISDNPEAAIGLLNQIDTEDEKINATIVMLKAVSYYHNDNVKKQKEMMNLWKEKYLNYYPYNYQLLQDN